MTAARTLRSFLVLGLLACVAAPAAAVIGTVQFAVGSVQVRDAAGNLRALRKGDRLNEGDAILTGAGGSTQVKMIDGGILAVRPDSELKLDNYRYQGREDGTESALMSLVKGGFRTITGFIGRVNKSRYTIHTPTATVGIRGTDHEPFFIPPGSTRAGAAPGTYDKVNDGIAFIASGGAEQNIGKNQMGYAAPEQRPVLLPVNPELFKATPPVQKPAAKAAAQAEQKSAAKTGKTEEQAAEEKSVEGTTPAADEAAPATTEAAPSDTTVVDAPPPPPPAPPATQTTNLTSPTLVETIVQDITGTDAQGNVLSFQTLDLTPFTSTGPASSYDHIVLAPVSPYGAGITFFDTAGTPQPESSYQTDASGNVAMFSGSESGYSLQFNSTPQDSFVSSDVRLGRWEGGSYVLTSPSGAQTVPLGAASAHWIFGIVPPPGLAQRFSGSVSFSPIAHTSPTDALGNVGSLASASLFADFTAQTVNASVSVSIGNRSLLASGSGPIFGNYFYTVGSASCSGTGCDSSYGAYIDGGFAGGAAKKAAVSYELAGSGADVVQGVVAFQAGSTPTVTAANSAILAAQDAALAANEIAAALVSIGKTTEAAQAANAASQATAAASAVNSAVSTLFAATSTSGAQAALDSLDAAVANAINGASQTLALATELLALAGPAPLAQLAADAAQLSAAAAFDAYQAALGFETDTNTTLAALDAVMTVDTGPAASAISLATSAKSLAQPSVDAAAAIDVTAAATNTVAVANLHATVEAQSIQAQTAFSANGPFADSQYAVPANALTQSNAGIVHNSDVAIQNAWLATGIATPGKTVSQLITEMQAAVNDAVATLAAASAQLTAANDQLTLANTSNTTITNAQSSAAPFSTQAADAVAAAQLAATRAQTAANAAQTAATQAASLQSAGDFTGAQAALSTALAELANAQTELSLAVAAAGQAQLAANTANDKLVLAQSSATAATTAVSAAITAAGEAKNLADTAKAKADLLVTAASTTATELPIAQDAAAVVEANYKKAQYSNPAVASVDFVHFAQTTKPVTGGYERSYIETLDDSPLPNTNYVLDENKNLIEARTTVSRSDGWNYQGIPITDANMKYSGGTPNEHYHAADGTVYLGRWQGGTIDVTDNDGVYPPFTQALGALSAHWIVGLTPGFSSTIADTFGPVPNVQTVIGSRPYTLTWATKPTDTLGNVGTLNSATFSANFTALTADASVQVGFLGRGLTLSGTAANMPIVGNGFERDIPFSCEGSCTTSWSGNIGGVFLGGASGGVPTGTVGTGVGLGYEIAPLPGGLVDGNLPFSDFIHGLAVFNTTTAPEAGVTQSFADNAKIGHAMNYLTPKPGAPGEFNVGVARTFAPEVNPNTHYLFDAGGSLVRIFDTSYGVYDRGTLLANATDFPAPSPIDIAQISFGGGGSVAAEAYSDAGAGVRLGRWSGGFITVVDVLNEVGYLDPLGTRSAHWLVYQSPSVLPVSGRYHYLRSYATAPTDGLGNVGVLNGARLDANFSANTVSAAMSLSIANQNVGAWFSYAPIQDFGFNVSSNSAQNPAGSDFLHVGCYGTGCAPSYSGRITGGLSATGGEGAYFRYNLGSGLNFIEGAVAFGQGPAVNPPAPASADTNVALSYFRELDDSMRTQDFVAAPGGVTLDGSDNLTSVTESNQFDVTDDPHFLQVTGGTPSGPTAAFTASTGTNPTGITFGRWSAATISGQDWDSTFGPLTVLGDLHWIKGPELWPWYITQAVTGTFQYAFDGGSVTDQDGTAGTFNSASTRLTADFNRQSLDATLDFSLPARSPGTSPRNFVAQADDIMIQDAGSFHANTGGSSPHQNLNVWLNTPTISTPNAWGSLNGQFTGTAGSGAIMSFAFAGSDPSNSFQHEHASGTAAFVIDPAVHPSPGIGSMNAYRVGVMGTGLSANTDVTALDEWTKYFVELGINAASRVAIDNATSTSPGTGMPLAFDGFAPTYIPAPPTCSTCTPYVNDLPARFTVRPSDFTARTELASLTPATIVNSGIDAETGLRWGRYAGGHIAVIDRISGATMGTIDTTLQNAHFAISGVNSGPVVLPITGSANYTLIGNTNPTDNFGNVGTLGNATLAVDFANQKVNTSVNLSIGGNNWAANTPASVPIFKGAAFFAEKTLSGAGNLAVTVTGGTAATAGNIGGVFTGPTGKGAAIGYSLHHNGALPSTANPITGPTSVTGVAVFKRP